MFTTLSDNYRSLNNKKSIISKISNTEVLFIRDLFKRLNGSKVYSVDSFPAKIC